MNDDTASPMTGWIYSVPLEYRELIQAAFPDYVLNFISVRQPAESYAGRILNTPNSFFAVMGHVIPPDLEAFAGRHGLPVGTVSLHAAFADLTVATANPLLVAINRENVFFSPMTSSLNSSIGVALNGPDAAAARTLLDQVLSRADGLRGVSVIDPVIRLFKGHAGQRVLAVLENTFLSRDRSATAAEALPLLKAAKARFPEALIVLMADKDIVAQLTGDKAVHKIAELVVATRPMAQIADHVDVVVTTGGQFGFEAAVAGKRVVAVEGAFYVPGFNPSEDDHVALSSEEAAALFWRVMTGPVRWISPRDRSLVDPSVLFADPVSARNLMLRGTVTAPRRSLNADLVRLRAEMEREEGAPPKATALKARYQADPARAEMFSLRGVEGFDPAHTVVYAGCTASYCDVMTALGTHAPAWRFVNLFAHVDMTRGLPPSALNLAANLPDVLLRLLSAEVARLSFPPTGVVFFETTTPVSRMLLRVLSGSGVRCVLFDLFDELSVSTAARWGFDAVIARPEAIDALHGKPVASHPLETAGLRSALRHGLNDVQRRLGLAGLESGRKTFGVLLGGPVTTETEGWVHAIAREVIDRGPASGYQTVLSLTPEVYGELPTSVANEVLRADNLYVDFEGRLFPGALTLASVCDVVITDSPDIARLLADMDTTAVLIAAPDVAPLASTRVDTISSIGELSVALDVAMRQAATPAPAVPVQSGQAFVERLTAFLAEASVVSSATPRIAGLTLFEQRLLDGADLEVECLGIDSGDNAAQGTQAYLLEMIGAKSRTRAVGAITDAHRFTDIDLFAQWGMRDTAAQRNLRTLARQLKVPVMLLEDGLVRSVSIGLSGDAGLSVLIDTRTAYFNATQPSLMEVVLNSELELTPDQIAEAKRLMKKIVSRRVSKYNHAPDTPQAFGRPGHKKILLVDQRFGDMSIALGLGTEDDFPAMLWGLVGKYRDADFVIKRHPDALSKLKSSCFGDEVIAPARFMDNVILVDYDINPFALMDAVNEVHVVTSGFGFEAVMAGMDVHCHGAPFYSGWGFTTDYRPHPRRTRKRTAAEVFYVAYLMLSRYYSPRLGGRCSLEDLVDYIADEVQKVRGVSV